MLLDRFDNEIKPGVRILYPKIEEGNTKRAKLSIYEVVSVNENAVTKKWGYVKKLLPNGEIDWESTNEWKRIIEPQPHINAREIFPNRATPDNTGQSPVAEEVGKIVTLRYYREAIVINEKLIPKVEEPNEE